MVRVLRRLGYEVIRQSGSHVQLAVSRNGFVHKLTIPMHKQLRIGTLDGVLEAVAAHLGMERSRVEEKVLIGR